MAIALCHPRPRLHPRGTEEPRNRGTKPGSFLSALWHRPRSCSARRPPGATRDDRRAVSRGCREARWPTPRRRSHARQQRELRESFAQMRLAFALALALLYLTIAAFYESLILPLLIIAAVPIG